jgi:hypothetical protein
MKKFLGVVGMLLSMGVAHADSPGGWSQFNEMTKPRTTATVTTPQVQQTTVYEFPAGESRGTWLHPPHQNEGANN